jgi:hypothetical protein
MSTTSAFVDHALYRSILKGLITYVPGAMRFKPQRGTGGTDSALYCYAVWIKHLSLLCQSGMLGIPKIVGEIGPGDSIGVGLAALLSGADHYVALDVVQHANDQRNLDVLAGLVELFHERTPRPIKGWPDFDSALDDRFLPASLGEALLSITLDPERVRAIRAALVEPGKPADGICVEYAVPWTAKDTRRTKVQLALSHSVLEHVSDVEGTYRALSTWVDDDGWMSHQIDYTSHAVTTSWNGHWTVPDPTWRVVVGRRQFLINRQPHSTHVSMHQRHGFEIKCNLSLRRDDGVARERLARRWRQLSDADLHCAGGYIASRRETAALS